MEPASAMLWWLSIQYPIQPDQNHIRQRNLPPYHLYRRPLVTINWYFMLEYAIVNEHTFPFRSAFP